MAALFRVETNQPLEMLRYARMAGLGMLYCSVWDMPMNVGFGPSATSENASSETGVLGSQNTRDIQVL